MATTFKEISEYLTGFTLPFEYHEGNQIYIRHDLNERQTTHITLAEDGDILHITTCFAFNILESIGVTYQEKNIVDILKYMLLKNEERSIGYWRLSTEHAYIEFGQTLCLMDTSLSKRQLAKMISVVFDEGTEKMFQELRLMINPDDETRTDNETFFDSVIKDQEQYQKDITK